MAQLCISFGQDHVHRINGKTFDCDCIAVIVAETIEQADKWAFEWFHGKFHQHVDMKKWDDSKMHYYPRGYIGVN